MLRHYLLAGIQDVPYADCEWAEEWAVAEISMWMAGLWLGAAAVKDMQ